jgi:hypothetical protein
VLVLFSSGCTGIVPPNLNSTIFFVLFFLSFFLSGYAACRWGLLSEADVNMVRERGWTGPLKDVGIAGMRNPQKVKCLHTMYAHWLAGNGGDRRINECGR